MGTELLVDQNPCRSGCPSDVFLVHPLEGLASSATVPFVAVRGADIAA